MSSLLRVGLIAALALSPSYGCDEEESEPIVDDEDWRDDEDELEDEDWPQDDGVRDAGSAQGGGTTSTDAGRAPTTSADAGSTPATPPPAPAPSPGQRTDVPAELVGTWTTGSLDFALWENYRQGYWAGRNAVPSREAMIFSRNGDAKFYRYEAAFNFYEELIDCEGTVAFHGDGTFTFYPSKGRKRFYDARYSEKNTDRALTATELTQPKLAGRRAYAYLAGSNPGTVQITVPSSAPYNWYKQE